MDRTAYTDALAQERMKLHAQLNDRLDNYTTRFPGKPLDAEETAAQDAINAEIDSITATITRVSADAARERESAQIRETNAQIFGTPTPGGGEKSQRQQFSDWARGKTPGNSVDPETGKRGFEVDLSRAATYVEQIRAGVPTQDIRNSIWSTVDSGSLLIPTDLESSIYAFMTASVAMVAMPTTKFTTSGGNPIDFPKVVTHGVGTMVGEGTAIGGTDPVFGKMTLNAYKYGQLVKVSTEMLADDGVDLVGFLAQNVGRAVGEVLATDLVSGSGSSKPNGIMTAITNAAVNGGTVHGVVAGITYEDLVTCAYRVNGNYRSRSSAAWLMHDSTAGSLRKLRDGAGGTVGAVLWAPSLTEGIQGAEPGRLIGHPVWTDPNVASIASTNKVAAFGDWSAYYIRFSGGFRFERSDEYAFNTDEVTFRGLQRADGDVIDIGRAFNGIRVV